MASWAPDQHNPRRPSSDRLARLLLAVYVALVVGAVGWASAGAWAQ